MTYFAKKENPNGFSLMAYFDTYSGRPMKDYPYTIRLDVERRIKDKVDVCIISVVKDGTIYFTCDTALFSHLETREQIEKRITRIARAALYERNAQKKDRLEEIYSPKRDFRERKTSYIRTNPRSDYEGYDQIVREGLSLMDEV